MKNDLGGNDQRNVPNQGIIVGKITGKFRLISLLVLLINVPFLAACKKTKNYNTVQDTKVFLDVKSNGPSCSEAVCYLALIHKKKAISWQELQSSLLRHGTLPGSAGTLLAVKEFLAEQGLETKAVRVTYNELKSHYGAMVVHMLGTNGEGHFAFCIARDDKIFIYDPSLELSTDLTMSQEFYESHSTGNVLIIL